MQTSFSEITTQVLLISTGLLLLFGACIIYFLFFYQRKRFRHQNEVSELKANFSKMLLQSKLEIQEQTLDHIGKELHANIGQIASLININLQEILHDDTEMNRGNIMETKSLTKQLLAELKALSTSLNTDHIMKIGFVKALENELGRLAKVNYEVKFTKSGETFALGSDKEIILFRLCQEVLNNIIKHAMAKSVNVTLRYNDDNLNLTIEDDGKGFVMDEIGNSDGTRQSTGLLNMKKRIKLINGEIDIKSELEAGTKVSVTIPKQPA
ncbi:MAG: ATP-binding protein [Bacteroidota bacterium]